MQVVDKKKESRRYYLNDYLNQNTYDPVQKKSLNLFTYMLHGLARVYSSVPIDSVLCIGLGVGIVPMEFSREGGQGDVVEINPAIISIAEKFFDLDRARLKITVGDGRYWVNRSAKTYDCIVLDAFLGESPPAHLMTVEAFRA